MVYGAPCASHFYLEAELTFQLNNSKKHLLPHGVVLQINQQLLRKRNGVLQFQGRLFFKEINVDLWVNQPEVSARGLAMPLDACLEVMQSRPCIGSNAVTFLAKLILHEGNESLHLCSPLKTFNQTYLLGRDTEAELPIYYSRDFKSEICKQTRSPDGVKKQLLYFYDMQLSWSMKNSTPGSPRPRSQSGAKCFHKTFATVFTNGWRHLLLF